MSFYKLFFGRIFTKSVFKDITIKNAFSSFYDSYAYMQTQELIEYYSVFEGLEEFDLKPDVGLLENITYIYLENFEALKEKFTFSDDLEFQKDIQHALTRLSRGDRKRFSIYKDVSKRQGQQVYKKLFEDGIIKEEISREKPFRNQNKRHIKKEFRGYKIENKIHFINEATRFWFNFIAPNEEFIRAKEFEKVIKQIKLHVEKHISLSFEILSEELVKTTLPPNSIISSGSFWSKNSEIDLLVKSDDGLCIVGESKWKNSKICKNVLNSLVKKADFAKLNPTHYALFSKSGFSKELLSLKDETLMLFTLKDFERLYR